MSMEEDAGAKVAEVTLEEVETAATQTPVKDNAVSDEKPHYPSVSGRELRVSKTQYRKVQVPRHRYTPLKNQWPELYKPIVERLKLQVRMNLKSRCVELRTSYHTEDPQAIQKGAEFVRAFIAGFEVRDALALLRLDDLFVESFEVHDVRMLRGEHLARAIGRIAGKDGRTKFTIENATKTRIVLAETRIHILGSYQNTRLARDAICNLIIGTPPSKIYNKLRTVAARMNERH